MAVTFSITMRSDTEGADALAKLLTGDPGAAAEMDVVMRQWGARYLGFVRRRFVAASRGDGTWKPLAESTIKSRRSGRVAGLGKLKGVKRKAGALREVRKRVKGGVLDAFVGTAIETSILGSAAILRDTGVLLNALSPGTVGNLLQPSFGELRVRCGFAPVAHGEGSTTIQDIAAYHDAGGGKLPQRKILVEPDDATVRGMLNDLATAITKISVNVATEKRGGSK